MKKVQSKAGYSVIDIQFDPDLIRSLCDSEEEWAYISGGWKSEVSP